MASYTFPLFNDPFVYTRMSLYRKIFSPDIARGTSEKTSSDWLVGLCWGFLSLVILVPRPEASIPHKAMLNSLCFRFPLCFQKFLLLRGKFPKLHFPENFSYSVNNF